MCGSAPVPAEVMKKFEETFNCPVIEGYGLSESTCDRLSILQMKIGGQDRAACQSAMK